MSTLYDALKKASSDREKQKMQNQEEKKGNDMHTDENNAHHTENMKVVILLIAVVAVFGIAFFRFALANKWINFSKKPAVSVAKVVSPAVVQEPIKKDPYVLNGVIDDGENSIAIINGKLLKLSDKIEGWQVKSISTREVSLFNSLDEQSMVLKIK